MALLGWIIPRLWTECGNSGTGSSYQMIRQAIQFAWVMLPDDRKTVMDVERVIREIVDPALKELREDADKFGLGK